MRGGGGGGGVVGGRGGGGAGTAVNIDHLINCSSSIHFSCWYLRRACTSKDFLGFCAHEHTDESFLFLFTLPLFLLFLQVIHHCLCQWTENQISITTHYRLRKECVFYAAFDFCPGSTGSSIMAPPGALVHQAPDEMLSRHGHQSPLRLPKPRT